MKEDEEAVASGGVAANRLRADVEALACRNRGSASAGERAGAAWLAERVRHGGTSDVRVEPYRGQSTYAWAQLAHLALGATRSKLLAAVALAALEGEVSGRTPTLRRLLPAGAGANVVARRASEGPRRRILVLVAHHDAARTGWVWDPRLPRLQAARRLRRRAMDPFAAPLALGIALAPTRLRRLGLTLLGLAAVALLDVARRPPVPGASDNATGVAAVLALLEGGPPDGRDGIEVWAVLPGAEESGMDGMRAFLARHGAELAAIHTLVLGLDTLGSGTPVVVAREGALLAHAYSPEDLALVPPGVERWRLGGWTDPILARWAGLRALSLVSVNAEGGFTAYHRPEDTPARVDWASVGRSVELAEEIVRRWARDTGAAA